MLSSIDQVIARVQATYSTWKRDTSPDQMRADWEALFGGVRIDATIEEDRLASVPVTRIAAKPSDPARLFLYFHGGGYLVGSPRSHADLIARISFAAGATGLCVAYRRAPEHQFPAPIDDALAVCEALDRRGVDLRQVAFVGDSAGGNLALATVLALKARASALPAAVVLLSPWTDLEALGESYETRKDKDPIHQRRMILEMSGRYLAGADPAQPLASPLNGDLTGFPPVLIQVGDRETVLSDAVNLNAAALAAGVESHLHVWDGMIHVFQQFSEELPEARAAIDEIGRFLKPRLGATKEVRT
ncbi:MULTISPECIES: alpha/beta hydrolase [Brevundimonas]|uniref:6-hexanolactone hydrolase n=1 Tax=Brevundimonas abyssalis TAR-001 TaxID=1391729 RepID=A0A8E0KIH1_9CAUL|nr:MULTISPECIES: alpha/beta hydrolase [Brevundimonas]GAD58638.1 6-hexanolactone hydrolase [Brevundimonas abyssalis TAR-001]